MYTWPMAQGFFLTFEGLDGSGKTTQLRRLAAGLRRAARRPLVTRQPGGTKTGDRIRALLLDSKTEALDPRTELGLMFADRAQAIAEVIAPALEQGRIVLCDRFTDSTEAYQGGGRELGSEIVLALHGAMCGGLQPDLPSCCFPILKRHWNARAAAMRAPELPTRAASSARGTLFIGASSKNIAKSLRVSLCVWW